MPDLKKGYTVIAAMVEITRRSSGEYTIIIRGHNGICFGGSSPDPGIAFNVALNGWLDNFEDKGFLEEGKTYGRDIEI